MYRMYTTIPDLFLSKSLSLISYHRKELLGDGLCNLVYTTPSFLVFLSFFIYVFYAIIYQKEFYK